jgi:hypothetical protein
MEITTSKPAATGDIPTLDRRIADLRRELSLLEAEARAQERQHRADVLRAMKELLLRHGFSPAELTNATPNQERGQLPAGCTALSRSRHRRDMVGARHRTGPDQGPRPRDFQGRGIGVALRARRPRAGARTRP